MEYNVNFIGLTFFEPLAGDFRRIWMPDGRNPDPDIQPHYASIVIASSAYRDKSGWLPHEISENGPQFEYFFPPSTLSFPSTQSVPDLDTSQLDEWLIHLRHRDPRFDLSGDPEYIAQSTLMHGSVAAFSIDNTGDPKDPGTRQYFARWTIPNDSPEPFTIVLLEERGWPLRTLTIAPRSDVSVINTSRGPAGPGQTGDHFRLYEKISGVPVDLSTPQTHKIVPLYTGKLPVFTNPMPATEVLGCSPTTP